ncbi:MAG: Re/Si-specific NAD(P)(+) transhydrogenase subunit alpha [Deinococcota bacterium]
MHHIVAVRDTDNHETRVALTPAVCKKLVDLGLQVTLEAGFGERLHLTDSAYHDVGVTLKARAEVLAAADILVSLHPPAQEDLAQLPEGAALASFLDPFRQADLIKYLASNNLSALAMELIPRSTYAQKMDALSSQASLAGYAAVIGAADRINKALPMMTTPAGTIAPARVFVVGVGVAGLQAIATAKRLGARVEAYDTRPVVAEQVASLGAKFVSIDVGETGQTAQGYAKALTDEQLAAQRKQMGKYCANADIIITTAQLFGRPAPRIITAEMVAGMKPGSIIVDLAASTGGNVEGSKADEDVVVDGVTIIGFGNFPGTVARDASQMYASNIGSLLEHLWDKESKTITFDLEDDITQGALLTHQGEIRDERVREAVSS